MKFIKLFEKFSSFEKDPIYDYNLEIKSILIDDDVSKLKAKISEGVKIKSYNLESDIISICELSVKFGSINCLKYIFSKYNTYIKDYNKRSLIVAYALINFALGIKNSNEILEFLSSNLNLSGDRVIKGKTVSLYDNVVEWIKFTPKLDSEQKEKAIEKLEELF